MSSLTKDDFTADEQEQIQILIDDGVAMLASLDGSITDKTDFVSDLQNTDDANQRVQDKAIEDIVAILHGIVQQRDIDEPGEAPHFIDFLDDFPVVLADLSGSDPLPSIPPYDSPSSEKSVENGTGWELWRTIGGVPELDPDQPSAGELGATYPDLVDEFNDFQTIRLDNIIGSNVLLSRHQGSLSIFQAQKTVIETRNNFYLSIGFEVSS